MKTVVITYKGELDEELEKELEEKLIGWDRGSSGYNFKTQERDIEYSRE